MLNSKSSRSRRRLTANREYFAGVQVRFSRFFYKIELNKKRATFRRSQKNLENRILPKSAQFVRAF
jgi:hypothetical protein